MDDAEELLDEIGRELAVDPAVLRPLLGGPWYRLPLRPAVDDLHATSAPTADASDAPWFASGTPPQVLLGVSRSGTALVGTPRGQWLGHELVYSPSKDIAEVSIAAPDDLDAFIRAVRAAAERRRRTFRWCDLCRTVMPPEERLEGKVCMSCGSRYLGIVH